MMPTVRERAVEVLADVEHDRWAGWQKWVHDLSKRNADGSITIPAKLVERWDRQISTEYAGLSDDEKESDRKEARTSLDALEAAGICLVDRGDVEGAISVILGTGPNADDYECVQNFRLALAEGDASGH